MHTLDQNLQKLVSDGLVDKEEAYEYLFDKDALRKIYAG